MEEKKLSKWRVGLVASGTICLIGMLVFLIFPAKHEDGEDGYHTVYENLPMAEAGNTKDFLEEEHHIAVKLGNNGTSIRVPKEQVEKAISALTQKGMPGNGIVGYEVFDKMHFISTDFEKRRILRRQRGLPDLPEESLFDEGHQPTPGIRIHPADLNQKHNTEDYARIYDNAFLPTNKNPLSTFSIDVDTAAYSNLRDQIESGEVPPQDAARIEEMINYFPYDYPEPTDKQPFSITTDVADCPWKPQHKLLRIGLHGKSIKLDHLPPQNLVFLIDVSGSMDEPNKLPLVQQSLKLLVKQLRAQDHVSIVVYAGAAGLVLPPTNGDRQQEILTAITKLVAGGSTAGGEGIELAYQTAKQHFQAKGNNRVILATDGDFNVGPSSDGELIRLIEDKRKQGIYLTVLGYGRGNYKDSKLEQLADKGNGNHAYIDNIEEAQKVLVTERGGTLLTIAKDVKLQLEFNPSKVSSYRLIGYENRLLNNEDFEDDTKDAGELGSGTTVTALYELTPATEAFKPVALRYQQNNLLPQAQDSQELLSIKLRYKQPDSETSQLLAQTVTDQTQSWSAVSQDFRFAAAVAGFGMQLRKSEHKGSWKIADVISQASQSLGEDKQGYRLAFVGLAEKAQTLIAAEANSTKSK